MNFESQFLTEILENELNKRCEDISSEELEKIKTISINKYQFSLEKNDIKLEELKKLNYLENIKITNFDIYEKDINTLNNFRNLKTIQFTYCNFYTKEKFNNKLENIVIDNCFNFNFEMINGNDEIKIIGTLVDMKNLNSFNGIKKLSLLNCDIENFEQILNLNNLEYLDLSGCFIKNRKILDFLKQKVKLIVNDKYYPTGM